MNHSNKDLKNFPVGSLTSNEVIREIDTTLRKNIDKSLDKNPEVFSKLMEYVNLLYYWRRKIPNVNASVILDEVNYDMLCSINIGANGMYRIANSCLRSAIELGLSFFYFLDYNYKFLLWKEDKYDIKWCEISDENTGILSNEYIGLFVKEITVVNFIDEVKKTYRECSQYVHGKYHYMNAFQENKIKFDSEQLNEWSDLFQKVSEILIIYLTIRFKNMLNDFDEEEQELTKEILKQYGMMGVIE
ncbi:hypothetical protein [Clostridium sporogenes]|uniref:hypothetical protein n=1 Tax=Clostridium sporogenes TaxID=1509 RepID=UPI0013D19A83|nr:hypothetical protein [Clostridium sporogenes]NFP90179.1 hypothetical protein [Clostridium sporogenes]